MFIGIEGKGTHFRSLFLAAMDWIIENLDPNLRKGEGK